MKTAITQVHHESASTSRSVWIWIGLAAVSALLAVPFALKPPCPDVSTFDYVGWLASRGDTLYLDVIEQNWPGVMWLHTLATALFGNHLWSFRVIDAALLLVGCTGLFQLAKSGGQPATRYVVVLLYQLVYVSTDIWMTGQRDMLVSHVLFAVAALAVARMRGGAAWLPVSVGVLMAFASLTRPTCVLFLPLIFVVDALTRGAHRSLRAVLYDVLICGLAYAGALGAVALLAWYAGALPGWYTAAVVFNTLLYSQTATVLDFLHLVRAHASIYYLLVALAGVGLISWVRGGERQALGLALCLALTGLVSSFVQGKALGYHLAPVYGICTLLASEGISAAIAHAQRRRTFATYTVAAVCSVLALYNGGKQLYRQHGDTARYLLGRIDRDRLHEVTDLGFHVTTADTLRAVDYARAHTTPEQTILPWNRGIVINYLAERRLPTRLATVGMLDLLRDSFPSGRVWLQTFERMLHDDPPALVFTYNEQVPDEYEKLWHSGPELRATAMVRAALRSRYRRVARFGALDAYALQ